MAQPNSISKEYYSLLFVIIFRMPPELMFRSRIISNMGVCFCFWINNTETNVSKCYFWKKESLKTQKYLILALIFKKQIQKNICNEKGHWMI